MGCIQQVACLSLVPNHLLAIRPFNSTPTPLPSSIESLPFPPKHTNLPHTHPYPPSPHRPSYRAQLVGNVFQANKIDIYMSGDSSIGYDLLIANNTFSQATESSTVVYLPGRPYADGITLRGNTYKDMSPTTTVLLLQEPTSAISSNAMEAGVTMEGNTFHDIIIPAAKTGFVVYKATGAAVRHVEVRTAPVL